MTKISFEGLVARGQDSALSAPYEDLTWHDTFVWGDKAAKLNHLASVTDVIDTGSGHSAAVISQGGGFEATHAFSLRDAIMAIEEPLAAGQKVTVTISGGGNKTFHIDLTNTAQHVVFDHLKNIDSVTFTFSDPAAHLVIDDLNLKFVVPEPVPPPEAFRTTLMQALHDPAAYHQALAEAQLQHVAAAHVDAWIG